MVITAKVLVNIGTYIFGTSFTFVKFCSKYIFVGKSIICQVSVVQEIKLIIFSISVYLPLVTITILQVADCLPTLSVGTYYKHGRRENFSCSADRQREGEGGSGNGARGRI